MGPQDQGRKSQRQTSEGQAAAPGPDTAPGSEQTGAEEAAAQPAAKPDNAREATQSQAAQPKSKSGAETQTKPPIIPPAPAEAKGEGSQSQEAKQKSLAEKLRFEQRAGSRRRR
jgi:hypothetical protein